MFHTNKMIKENKTNLLSLVNLISHISKIKYVLGEAKYYTLTKVLQFLCWLCNFCCFIIYEFNYDPFFSLATKLDKIYFEVWI